LTVLKEKGEKERGGKRRRDASHPVTENS